MSIFRKIPISPGDLVIGINKHGWDSKGVATSERYFEEPAIVLEIRDQNALVFVEHSDPQWYNLNNLQRVYITDEFDGRRLAPNKLNYSDQSGNEDDE